ncbi:glycoside hydrolase family 3 N-terminal domain-containing protein [Kitasatospora sp. NPDC051853]|uniref:glycoside hydrolase family 3 N-terminal domain-containing protein n=1 Tax=Kitasatospora sp. NPDC051853 TaxID=3364058 RepID=UPI00378E28C1
MLDVYRAPGNFIDLRARSYSHDASVVTELGSAFTTARQRTGVAATAEHFPGLGTAGRNQNTDTRPVTLRVRLARFHLAHPASRSPRPTRAGP